MVENHPHPKYQLVPNKRDQLSIRSSDDSILVMLQNTTRQVYRLHLELAVKADEYGKSESTAHCLKDIQSTSENLLVAMEAFEAMIHVIPSTAAHISPGVREEISLGNPVPCPKLSERQEKVLTRFLAEFGS